MIYADYLSTAEMQRWNLDIDIAWDDVDVGLALGQPALLQRVRDSALIESFFPIFTCRAMDRLWEDVAATAVFSIQLYEVVQALPRVQPVSPSGRIPPDRGRRDRGGPSSKPRTPVR